MPRGVTIDGEVDRSTQLTLSELKKLPRAETTCVLQCAGNGRTLYSPTVPGVQWRYGAAGNLEELPKAISLIARKNDILITLGAGSITNWANSLPSDLAELEARSRVA